MKWDNLFIKGNAPTDADGTVVRVGGGEVAWITEISDIKGDAVCISSLTLDDDVLDACIEYVLENHPKLYVVACEKLTDVGMIESRFHLSPVMLLHKLGLLDEHCTVVGANFLDNDDVDLMAQCGADVVLCPTYSCGNGYGFPNVIPMLGKIRIGLGTMDNVFNKSGSVIEEAKTLYLGTNCSMRSPNALKISDLAEIMGFDGSEEQLIKLLNM